MFPEKQAECDLAVIGAGLAGISAAVAAARRGVKVCLIHDRPVLGGNASSEVRMWVCGASDRFPAYREGGILEEIALKNAHLNPDMNYPMWDAVLRNLIMEEPNIALYLNTVCTGAVYEGRRILSLEAFQTTTYTKLYIKAKLFADCSGDSVLADVLPVPVMKGRESAEEYGESLGRELPDPYTMGNSVLLQARETDGPVRYDPPAFARKIDPTEFRYRLNTEKRTGFTANNFWWIERGGTRDTLRDAEEIQKELLADVYGVWDYIKNSGIYDAENWDLDFVGYYPAKRETRRYRGAYVLSQRDIEEGRAFEDEIAYGGWTMDDHDPRGFFGGVKPNTFHPIPGPYAIPWRCLYTEAFENLAFAGRNISVTHLALSSTRVMATCALLGQAVGTGVSLAMKYCCGFGEVGGHAAELKQALRDDDCYLLRTPRVLSPILLSSENDLTDKEKAALFNGEEREFAAPAVRFPLGKEVCFRFERTHVGAVRLLFDDDIARTCQKSKDLKMYPQRCHIPKERERAIVPPRLTKKFCLDALSSDGTWFPLAREEENILRLYKIRVDRDICGVRYTGLGAWDPAYTTSDLFSLDFIP